MTTKQSSPQFSRMTKTLRWIALYMLPSWVLLAVSIRFCSPQIPRMAIYTLGAIASSIWLFYGLWQMLFISRKDSQGQTHNHISRLSSYSLILAIFLITSFFAYRTGAHHDYTAYQKQWQIILDGIDPWLNTNNAYGPAHNIFAGLYKMHSLLPKLVFSWLLLLVGLVSSFSRLGVLDNSSSSHRHYLFAFLTLSPFALITVGYFANNDILPAALMVVALVGIVGYKGRPVRFFSGCALAIGCMYKFYPVILLPFLCIRKRIIDWTFLQGFLATLLVAFGLAYSRWGSSIFIPLRFAADRHSKHLSIFNFIRAIGLDIDHLSIYAIVAGIFVWIIFCIWKKIDPFNSSVVGFAIVLSLYKVGHQQFFLFFFLVAPFAIRYWMSSFSRFLSGRIVGIFLIWLSYLNWYQLEYSLTCGMWEWPARAFRHTGGLFYATISIASGVAVGRLLKSKSA